MKVDFINKYKITSNITKQRRTNAVKKAVLKALKARLNIQNHKKIHFSIIASSS